jgi:predicted TIM-barrel fold metal-dependent hydrolase
MSRIIDWHNHWLSPKVVEALSKRSQTPRIAADDQGNPLFIGSTGPGGLPPLSIASGFTSVKERLNHLDKVGVERQVISWPTTLGTDAALSAADAVPIWKAYNEDLSALVAAHPDRLSGLAILPTSDLEWAAKELARAHEELGLLGATLPVGSFHTLEGAQHFRPLLEVAQKYRSHIYLHTGSASAGIPGQVSLPASDLFWPRFGVNAGWSFASAIVTLTLSDFLEPYPDVTFQAAMLGGAVTFHAEFFETGVKNASKALRRVFIDTGVFGRGPRAVALAVKAVGADRILFGSDYPLAPIDVTLDAIDRSEISGKEREQILSINGLELLASKGLKV